MQLVADPKLYVPTWQGPEQDAFEEEGRAPNSPGLHPTHTPVVEYLPAGHTPEQLPPVSLPNAIAAP